MKVINIFLLLILTAIQLKSQNIFFDNDKSGFHIGGQFTSSEGSTLLAISPGYTSKGKLTFGLTIGFEENSSLDLSSTAIRPFLSYLVLKQDDTHPVSVSVDGAYQYNTFSDIDGLTANILGFGLGIYHQIRAGNNFDIIPGGGVGWSRTTARFQGFSESESAIGYRLSVSGKFNKFYVTPSLNFSGGNSRFDLLLGILFPQ